MLFSFNKKATENEEVDLPALPPFGQGGVEPDLEEVLDDPLIHLVARSDKIAPEDLKGCVQLMREKIISRNADAT